MSRLWIPAFAGTTLATHITNNYFLPLVSSDFASTFAKATVDKKATSDVTKGKSALNY